MRWRTRGAPVFAPPPTDRRRGAERARARCRRAGGYRGWRSSRSRAGSWAGFSRAKQFRRGGADMTRCRIHERCRLPNPRFLFVALAMYGRFVLTPQGPNFMRWTEPQIAAVLWSWNHGLFSWTSGAPPRRRRTLLAAPARPTPGLGVGRRRADGRLHQRLRRRLVGRRGVRCAPVHRLHRLLRARPDRARLLRAVASARTRREARRHLPHRLERALSGSIPSRHAERRGHRRVSGDGGAGAPRALRAAVAPSRSPGTRLSVSVALRPARSRPASRGGW